MAAAFGVRLFLWTYTNRTWEDALITLAAVQNTFKSVGMTQHYGEGHVYSFSSALSVLIPLAGELVNRGSGLTTLRLVSLVTGPLAVYLTYLICRRLELGTWPSIFAMAYVALDHEEVFWGMAGMEAQVATAILLAGTYFVLEDRPGWSGLTFGLALLARPDFVIWVAPALVYILWKRGWLAGLKSAAPAAALFGPWLVFTQLYYGRIVPQTVEAKALAFSPIQALIGPGAVGPIDFLTSTAWQYFLRDMFLFAPFYDSAAARQAPLPLVVAGGVSLFVFVLAVQGAWWTRRHPGWLPAIAYAVAFSIYLLVFLGDSIAAWYLPPFRAVIAILVAAGLTRMARASVTASNAVAGSLALVFIVGSLVVFPLDRRGQEIADAGPHQVGLYLGRFVPYGDAVVTEGSGYVGYYSGAKLYDYPGLTSPTALHALEAAPRPSRNLSYLVQTLRPEYAVLRPSELDDLRQRYPETASSYEVVASLQSSIDQTVLGMTSVSVDTHFYVVRRR